MWTASAAVKGPACPAIVAVVASPYATDREYLRAILEQGGIRIIEAADHREALHAIGRFGPAVIVYDESFPWRDVLSYTAESCYPSRLIVVAMAPAPSFIAQVVNLGGYDVLSKPFMDKQVRSMLSLGADPYHVQRRPPASATPSSKPHASKATA